MLVVDVDDGVVDGVGGVIIVSQVTAATAPAADRFVSAVRKDKFDVQVGVVVGDDQHTRHQKVAIQTRS